MTGRNKWDQTAESEICPLLTKMGAEPQVAIWLFKNDVIHDQQMLDNALFFANINAALGELDKSTRDMRHHLLDRIAF